MKRYVDVDELLKYQYSLGLSFYDELQNLHSKRVVDVNDILSLPIANVRENIQGTWILKDNGFNGIESYYCSVCGQGKTNFPRRYCSDCGAELIGKRNEW